MHWTPSLAPEGVRNLKGVGDWLLHQPLLELPFTACFPELPQIDFGYSQFVLPGVSCSLYLPKLTTVTLFGTLSLSGLLFSSMANSRRA
ncbi:hypothetical protein Nepgr_024661 [Nepenthes gracilis]|uniref:Uncharacterized protein n=1 Tax=Nepenthes gracilis TaxID=150966 RepID=A0AAD3T389_NEPGR|nr:hypothetical protein Nepgr_024661 [Nepenthes gracilis]